MFQDAKYLGDFLKCLEDGYVRCCGVSLNDIMRTSPKTPVIVMALNEVLDANPVNSSTSKQDFVKTTTTTEMPTTLSTLSEPIVDNYPITLQANSENQLQSKEVRKQTDEDEEISNEIDNEKQVAKMVLKANAYTISTTDAIAKTSNTHSTTEINNVTETFTKPVNDSTIVDLTEVLQKTTEKSERVDETTTETTEIPDVTTHIIENVERATNNIEFFFETTDSTEAAKTTIETTETPEKTTIYDDIQSNTDISTENSELTRAVEPTTESITIEPTTIDPMTEMVTEVVTDMVTEISAQDKVNDIKARRPKLIDNVIQVYPNEMSGIPKTTPKNLPDRSNEMHVYDDDIGMKIHVIFSTNLTTTPKPIDVKQNEIADDDVTDNDEQGTNTITPEPMTTLSLATTIASTTKSTIALPIDDVPTITSQPKPKRRRFTPYRARPIMSFQDSIVTSTPSTTTYKPVYRTHPLLVPRKPKSKLQNSNKNDNDGENDINTTETPLINTTIEKTRKKLFNSGNRLNFLQRKAIESTTTELPTTEPMPVEKVMHVLNREFANSIDTEHKLMMERVRFAIKSAVASGNFKHIPRTFSGTGLNNRIETLEKMVERKINYAVSGEMNGLDEIITTSTTAKDLEENVTKKPFRGHSRYFDTTNRERARNRLNSSSNASTTTSRPEMAKKRTTSSENYLRRRTRVRSTTEATQNNISTTTENSKRPQTLRRRQSQAIVHNARQSIRKRNVARPKTFANRNTFAAEPTKNNISNSILTRTSKPSVFRPVTSKAVNTIPSGESTSKLGVSAFINEEKNNTVVRRSPNFLHEKIINKNAHRQNQLTRDSIELETSTFQRKEHDQNRPHLETTFKPMINDKNTPQLQQDFAINGHQKPLIIGPIPALKQITSDDSKIRFGLPAETQRTKFYF